jgi:O-antigen ligase
MRNRSITCHKFNLPYFLSVILLFVLILFLLQSPFIAMLFLLGSVILLLSFSDLTFGLLFLFAMFSFIPSDFIPAINVQIFGIVFNPQNVFILLLISFFLIKNIAKGDPILIKTPLNKYFIIFPIIVLIGLVDSTRYGVGIQKLFGVVLFFFVCCMTTGQLIKTHDFIKLIKGMVIIGGCVAVYGIIEIVLKKNVLFGRFFDVLGTQRIYSTIGNPVYLGAYIVPLVPLALFMSIKTDPVRKIFWVVCTGIILISLFLTVARGSWFSAILAILFYIKNKIKKIIFSILICLFLAVVVFMVFPDIVEFSKTRNKNISETVSFRHRLYAYNLAYNVLKDKPLFGLGLRNLQFSYGKYRTPDDPINTQNSQVNFTTDNMYLILFTETGLFGFGTIIIIFITLLRITLESMRSKFTDENSKDMLLAIFASLIGFMINQFTADSLLLSAPAFTFWILAGVIMAIKLSSETNEFDALQNLR